jgi:hypothetical protein
VTRGRTARKRPTVGERIIEGLEQAVTWTRGENDRVRVTLVQVPDVDVRHVRQRNHRLVNLWPPGRPINNRPQVANLPHRLPTCPNRAAEPQTKRSA